MKDLKDTCRIALVQAGPVMFDKDATIDKACKEIIEAGNNGAELIVFPESYIPCYPFGLTFGFTVGNRDKYGRLDWKVYYDNSVVVPSEDTDRLADAAAQAGGRVHGDRADGFLTDVLLYLDGQGASVGTGNLQCFVNGRKPGLLVFGYREMYVDHGSDDLGNASGEYSHRIFCYQMNLQK